MPPTIAFAVLPLKNLATKDGCASVPVTELFAYPNTKLPIPATKIVCHTFSTVRMRDTLCLERPYNNVRGGSFDFDVDMLLIMRLLVTQESHPVQFH